MAGDGQSLDTASRGAQTAGQDISGAFGTASTADAAFADFWTDRKDTGERIANVLLHQAGQAALAAQAFVDGDATMEADGEAAVNGFVDVSAPEDEG